MSKKALTSAEWAATFLAGGKHVYRRGHHYEWDGQRYVQIADNLLMKQISEFIGQRELRAATAQMVKQVAETIAQMTAVDDEQPEPFSLNGQLPENIIPFRNGLFSVDEYIKEKLSDASLHVPF